MSEPGAVKPTGVRIPIVVTDRGHEIIAARRCGEPLTLGVPLPRGAVVDPAALGLCDVRGREVPAQIAVTERWSDGSIRWLLVDFQAESVVGGDARYELHTREPRSAISGLCAVDSNGDVIVNTGACEFRCPANGGRPFAGVRVGGRPSLDATASGLIVEDCYGLVPVKTTGVTVEVDGPLRAVVRVDLSAGPIDRPTLRMTLRVHFFARSTAVRMALTIRNPRKAIHPGGRWCLGQKSSVYLRRFVCRFVLPAPDAAQVTGNGNIPSDPRPVGVVRIAPEIGSALEQMAPPVNLYQDSSGGTNWNSPVHVNRNRVVPATFRGYRLSATNPSPRVRDGLRATPAVLLQRGDSFVALAVEQFWQNCPKAIDATSSSIDLSLFPLQYGDYHELQGGEQKTHVFVVAFGADEVSGGAFDWVRAPLRARCSPGWYGEAGAVRYLTPAAADPHDEYLRLVQSAIEGHDTQFDKREAIDEYGWRHFGDLYADHEAVYSKGPAPLVSHYNNQYDAVLGFGCQFLRSGDDRWWSLMDDLARHVVDIDVYHTDEDRAAYNNGPFWHTCHYIDAGTSTHRSYPDAPGVSGGGPGSEHDYASGLLLHHALTGDPLSKETVVDFARWVIAMDDGRRSRWRWFDDGPTGTASATYSSRYHGPGRGAAYSINTLLDAYRLTRDAEFAAKAEEIVRRCVHPDDDIDALDLLDAERRWSYTVFLQVLARFLDDLAERGETGELYAYGRDVLLHYARWMVENERPYLLRPEILEFPTETWAAQDLRKAEVLAHAARHAGGPERARFVDRSWEFFHYAIETLREHVTHTLTRPQVLLTTHGYLHAYVHANPDASAPRPCVSHTHPARPAFVPQVVRVLRRLTRRAA